MATGKSYYARPSYRFIGTDQPSYFSATDSGLEFDEADLYNPVHVHSDSTDFRRKISSSSRSGNKSSNRPSASSAVAAAAASSLPINVPDWSKILREEYRDNRRRSIECDDDDGDYEDGSDWLDASGGRLPPHEFLAKTRMASFSVHEGVGRTLKGRDLSRVRNAIFEKIGFQD